MKKIKLLGKTFYNSEFLDMENIQDINGTFLQNHLDYEMITTQGYPDLLIRKGSYGWVPSGFKDGKRHYEKYVLKKDFKLSDNGGTVPLTDYKNTICTFGLHSSDEEQTDIVQYRNNFTIDEHSFQTFAIKKGWDMFLNYETNVIDIGSERLAEKEADKANWYKYTTLPLFYIRYGSNGITKVIPIEKLDISYDCLSIREITPRGKVDPDSLEYFGSGHIKSLHYTGNGLTFSGTPSIVDGIVDFTKTNPITSSLKGSELNKYTTLKFINRVKFTKNSGEFVNLYGNDGIRVNAFYLSGSMDYNPRSNGNWVRLDTGFRVQDHLNKWVIVQTIINQKTGALEMSISVEGGTTYKVTGNVKETFPDQNIQIGRGINGYPFTQGYMDLSKSVIYGDGEIISPWVALY